MSSEPDAHCLGCGYVLRGLTSPRCPECGQSFDPADPTTFSRKPPPGAMIRFLSRPLGWPTHVLAAVAAIVSLWAASVPGGRPYGIMVAAFGWACVGLIWLVRMVLRALIVSAYGRMSESRYGHSRSWLVVPCVALSTFLLCSVRAPLAITFSLSRPAMDRLVKEALPLPPGSQLPDRRLGLYYAQQIETIPEGVRFLIRGAGFIDGYGFAFSSQPLPEQGADGRYRPFLHGWYIYELIF